MKRTEESVLDRVTILVTLNHPPFTPEPNEQCITPPRLKAKGFSLRNLQTMNAPWLLCLYFFLRVCLHSRFVCFYTSSKSLNETTYILTQWPPVSYLIDWKVSSTRKVFSTVNLTSLLNPQTIHLFRPYSPFNCDRRNTLWGFRIIKEWYLQTKRLSSYV